METTRRNFVKGTAALFVAAQFPWTPTLAGPLPPDEWYWDVPTGVWMNRGASARILRAAERRAGVRVKIVPYPLALPTDDSGMTDFGRARRAGCWEYGRAWTTKDTTYAALLTSVETQMVKQVATLLSKVQRWHEPPHLRGAAPSYFDVGLHKAVAFYGVSPDRARTRTELRRG